MFYGKATYDLTLTGIVNNDTDWTQTTSILNDADEIIFHLKDDVNNAEFEVVLSTENVPDDVKFN